MFCSQCGKEIPEDAQSCPECNTKVSQPSAAPANRIEVKSGLVQAILVTLLCCLPFGIAAIVYAARVPGLVAAGDIAGAKEAAKKSNMWSWISFGLGLLANIIMIIIAVLSDSN